MFKKRTKNGNKSQNFNEELYSDIKTPKKIGFSWYVLCMVPKQVGYLWVSIGYDTQKSWVLMGLGIRFDTQYLPKNPYG